MKKLIAAQTGTRAEKLRLQKWNTVFKDHITCAYVSRGAYDTVGPCPRDADYPLVCYALLIWLCSVLVTHSVLVAFLTCFAFVCFRRCVLAWLLLLLLINRDYEIKDGSGIELYYN